MSHKGKGFGGGGFLFGSSKKPSARSNSSSDGGGSISSSTKNNNNNNINNSNNSGRRHRKNGPSRSSASSPSPSAELNGSTELKSSFDPKSSLTIKHSNRASKSFSATAFGHRASSHSVPVQSVIAMEAFVPPKETTMSHSSSSPPAAAAAPSSHRASSRLSTKRFSFSTVPKSVNQNHFLDNKPPLPNSSQSTTVIPADKAKRLITQRVEQALASRMYEGTPADEVIHKISGGSHPSSNNFHHYPKATAPHTAEMAQFLNSSLSDLDVGNDPRLGPEDYTSSSSSSASRAMNSKKNLAQSQPVSVDDFVENHGDDNFGNNDETSTPDETSHSTAIPPPSPRNASKIPPSDATQPPASSSSSSSSTRPPESSDLPNTNENGAKLSSSSSAAAAAAATLTTTSNDTNNNNTQKDGASRVQQPKSVEETPVLANKAKLLGQALALTAAGAAGGAMAPPIVLGEHAHPNAHDHLSKRTELELYNAIPLLEVTHLPRGGLSVETKAVGRVQFGIPPETIKDSMRLGIPVPQVYIVPVERFCREMGPALGVNLAEFEFPAYFNFFVYKKRCTLVVDSLDAEENIRRVFAETLLGPAQFRREQNPITHESHDFDPSFPKDAIPNFQKEFQHFRIMPDGSELVIETLLNFRHFHHGSQTLHAMGRVPVLPVGTADDSDDEIGLEELVPYGLDGEKISDDDDSDNDGENMPVPKDLKDVESLEEKNSWTFTEAKQVCEVSTLWPSNATDEEIQNRCVPRVEILKMPGGTEYIIHDVDENNNIIGRARFSGHVKVEESMCVDGFGAHSIIEDVPLPSGKVPVCKFPDPDLEDASEASYQVVNLTYKPPPTFHPPSFGVTVLGNSHGFDKSGSVSGYVLWINGRGVMIDPPPYSSATLEREGIRPRTIVGIILTHCHADHDAGAFQKVLTGSPVVVITTPTIYKSFIRKYAALSALSPALLRHSHRYKPALIGQPLRFQGATFHFTYTLHTIPCVGFRVEWRGRSIVFTGDHFNSPPALDKLQESGVLTKARADDLRRLPLQECDVLLHEAGAPPIHTPLDVLLALPERVKRRLYVVHTSALPEGCELRVAPTGTQRTIRLDHHLSSRMVETSSLNSMSSLLVAAGNSLSSRSLNEDELLWYVTNEYDAKTSDTIVEETGEKDDELKADDTLQLTPSIKKKHRSSVFASNEKNVPPPLVSLRPASSTDAWFILNLLSAVPFLSSLSYASTMEVLETARVDVFAVDSVVLPSVRRGEVLCVVWEGTCSERKVATKSLIRGKPLASIEDERTNIAVWHAGDWTGPIVLQPERRLSGESSRSKTHDVIAVSAEGVKVITIEFSSLDAILKQGSKLYQTYLERKANQEKARLGESTAAHRSTADQLLDDAIKELNVIEILNCNSAFRKLSAVQKRHLESLAEGPISFQAGERMWRTGGPVDKAFLVVKGTASFVNKRRNTNGSLERKVGSSHVESSMRDDAMKAIRELGVKTDLPGDESSMSSQDTDNEHKPDLDFLCKGFAKRADYLQKHGKHAKFGVQPDEESEEIDSHELENELQLDYTFTDDADPGVRSRRASVMRRRSSRARFANKVLGRLYSHRTFTGGLIFSRGHFLGDVSKMVEGLLSSDTPSLVNDESAPAYGFGNKVEGNSSDPMLKGITELIIQEQEGENQVMHTSTLMAGEQGCVVLVFPKLALIPFLDAYPGLLLSLLGTQVVV